MIFAVTNTPIGYHDPWIIPHPSDLESYRDTMPLSPMELTYSMIQSTSESPDSHHILLLDEKLDQFSSLYWVNHTSTSRDFLNIILPSEEAIMEIMTLKDKPWEYSHHRSSFLPFGEKK
jgi:hypothetical protein